MYLILGSLNFKVEKIDRNTKLDSQSNTHTFFFISSILGIYQILMFSVSIVFLIDTFAVGKSKDSFWVALIAGANLGSLAILTLAHAPTHT
jgi:small-conductance mechanosensitive channel